MRRSNNLKPIEMDADIVFTILSEQRSSESSSEVKEGRDGIHIMTTEGIIVKPSGANGSEVGVCRVVGSSGWIKFR